jgi:hypothetical protein
LGYAAAIGTSRTKAENCWKLIFCAGTSQLYDRHADEFTLDEVERIRF